jgi:hypothetical protein
MSFSSFSHSVDDIWAYDVKRPYQIVLLPGYKVPASLDKGDKDALWFYKETVDDRPVIVWDGFSPVALFEIIRECFDYEGSSRHIIVRNAETGRIVRDERDPRVLKMRPVRKAGWGPRKIRNHITELLIWSWLFKSDVETTDIYAELLSPHGNSSQETKDSYERAQLFYQRGMQHVDEDENHKRLLAAARSGEIKTHRACKYGAPFEDNSDRVRRDKAVGLLDISFHGMASLGRISVEDFPDGPPESFYRAAVLAGEKKREAIRLRAEEEYMPSSRVRNDDEPSGEKSVSSGAEIKRNRSRNDPNPF